ncbi:hypothetical protein BCD49_03515 [Pseudofrankia sp. EUN1h]|nr:hypothetical protein BCD49_03515 [Pseudofrankia sp. EUN1h]
MCCDDLVCARCASPVAEGRCPTCRAARAELHHQSGGFTVSPQLVALLLLVLTALALLAAHQVQ